MKSIVLGFAGLLKPMVETINQRGLKRRYLRKHSASVSARRSKIHKADSIPVYAIDRAFIDDVAAALERRSELSISIKDRELYLILADRNFTTTIVEHRIDSDG